MHHYSGKISTHHKDDEGKIFAWMALISSTGYSSFLTMLPIILSEKLKNDAHIGYYYSAAAIVSLLVSLGSTVLLRRYSKVVITKVLLTTLCTIFIGLTLTSTLFHFAAVDMWRVVCVTLFFIILAIFVRDFATEKELELAEGRFYLFSNMGWVIGPLAGGILANTFGNGAAFVFASCCYLGLLALFLHQHHKTKNPNIHHRKEEPKDNGSFWKNFRDFISVKELRQSFIITFGMYFWWSTQAVYMPLALSNLGYSQAIVGLVFSLSIIPLLLLEFHATDGAKKFGVRRYLAMGFALLSIVLFLFTFAAPSLLIKLMILVNIGAAFIEPNKEVFFFKAVKPEDQDRFYGIYNASYPMAYIIAPSLGSILLASFGINGIWLGASFVFILIALSALSIGKKY